MNRLLSLVLAAIIAVLLVGCSKTENSKGSDSEVQTATEDPVKADDPVKAEDPTKEEETVLSDNKCGDNAYWKLNGGILTISGSGEIYDFSVSTADTNTVTWVGDCPWFEDRANITGVVICEGITGVGSESFRGCLNMSSAELPDSLQYIGEDAFCGCQTLESIVVPDSVVRIGNRAFSRAGIKSLTLGSGVNECGDHICEECGKLEQVIFHDGITTIGEWAFDGCHNIKSISLPDSVTEIGRDAFSGCGGIEQFSFGNGITEIPEFLIPNSKIVSIEIPEGVTTIGTGAFGSSGQLSKVTLPSTLESISKNAFVGCSAISEVTFCGSEEQWKAVTLNNGNETLTKAKITCLN